MKTAREAGALTETLARQKPVEVPFRVFRGNAFQVKASSSERSAQRYQAQPIAIR